jgi:hypothetical protein
MTAMSNITRAAGDPKILRSGPSSLGSADRLSRALGWFGLGLGLTELLVPSALTRTLGIRGREGLVRAYGAREIGTGILALSVDKEIGLWGRVAGDGLDLLMLLGGLRRNNPRRDNVRLAIAAVMGVAALDLIGAQWVAERHRRKVVRRDYRDRSGFPQGLETARALGRAARVPAGPRGQPVRAGA